MCSTANSSECSLDKSCSWTCNVWICCLFNVICAFKSSKFVLSNLQLFLQSFLLLIPIHTVGSPSNTSSSLTSSQPYSWSPPKRSLNLLPSVPIHSPSYLPCMQTPKRIFSYAFLYPLDANTNWEVACSNRVFNRATSDDNSELSFSPHLIPDCLHICVTFQSRLVSDTKAIMHSKRHHSTHDLDDRWLLNAFDCPFES